MKKELISLYLMALSYGAAGALHFIYPKMYASIIPSWIPSHQFLVYLSGVMEILLGLFLLFDGTRAFSAWLIMAMLGIFLLLIHIPMVFYFYGKNAYWFWGSILRVPLQVGLLYWAYQFTD